MFEPLMVSVSFAYLVYTPPYILICAYGAGRARNGLWISIIPAILTGYVSLTEKNPEYSYFADGLGSIYGGFILVFGIAITTIFLHKQWRSAWPSLYHRDEETPFSILSILAAVPIVGAFIAYPFAIALTIMSLWKKRKNS